MNQTCWWKQPNLKKNSNVAKRLFTVGGSMLRNITQVSWKHFFWHFNVSGCDIWRHVTRSLTSKKSWIVDWQHGGRQYEIDVTVSTLTRGIVPKCGSQKDVFWTHAWNHGRRKWRGKVGHFRGARECMGHESRGLWGPHVAEDGIASINTTAGARTG